MANKDSGLTTGLLLGGIIGTVIGVLIAPKPGKETRSDVNEKTEYLSEQVDILTELLRSNLGPTVDTLAEKITPAISNIRDSLNKRDKIESNEIIQDEDISRSNN